MNRLKLALFCSVIIAATVVGMLMVHTGRAEAIVSNRTIISSSQGSCGTWSVVNSPNPGPSDNALGAVAAVSSSDVWAVGEYLRTGASSITQTLTEHWDGSRWTYIPSPNFGSLGNTFYGVSASSSKDVWAVGFYTDSHYLSHVLTEHWNGKQWSIISSPNPGSAYDNLFGVADISANNVWAVGFYRNVGDSSPTRTLIEHWDGKQWNVVNTPDTGSASNALFAVAVSSQSTWSIGRIESDLTPTTTLTEQWNGSRWHTVTSPSRGPSDNNLYGVSSVSSSDAWAAGNDIDQAGNARTLIEQWNGKQWHISPSPSPGGGGNNILGGIVALSANDIWAVGGYDNGGSTHTLIEHFC
jgi:hypothetical protein